jgi:hypothetical protein
MAAATIETVSSQVSLTRVGIAGLLIVAACRGPGLKAPGPGPQRDVITRQELLDSPQGDQDLLTVIRSLRPRFLAAPPGIPRASAAPLAVYLDGRRQPSLDALRSLRASAVEEVRYLDPTTAANELGPMASGGALTVKLFDPSRKPPA